MNIRHEFRVMRWKQIRWALEQTKGNQRAAARLVNLPNATFDRWVRELDLGRYAETMRAKSPPWGRLRRIHDANNLGEI